MSSTPETGDGVLKTVRMVALWPAFFNFGLLEVRHIVTRRSIPALGWQDDPLVGVGRKVKARWLDTCDLFAAISEVWVFLPRP